MSTAMDRTSGEKLGYLEVVLLTNPSNSDLTGEVDDKYQYSVESQNDKVHGWISRNPSTGFRMITPNYEFRTGGPVKQDLTSHVDPMTLGIFMSDHYGGTDVNTKFQDGESWKKMEEEVQRWPYDFIQSKDYPGSSQRGNISSQLNVHDRYVNGEDFGARLSVLDSHADEKGHFMIKNVRPGLYNLYAWVPRFLGDYKYEGDIVIIPGSEINLGTLVFTPSRQGPTLWEIGIPDRLATEFYVPKPNPMYVNKVLLNSYKDRFRQDGLWERNTDIYDIEDPVYTVGVSNYLTDWFYVYVARGRWQHQQEHKSDATAFRVNDHNLYRPQLATRAGGMDNAIAKHGIHGLYRLFSIQVPGYILRQGSNTIYVTQPRSIEAYQGLMCDYIRLEGQSRAVCLGPSTSIYYLGQFWILSVYVLEENNWS
ncbi:hypothetical protein MLD38_003318 [Melastoma candidum]|uniref:Uncharacterized protein n=1 Tax=Melastoma candidum TaxID=119954 RepID=A0ACB9S464_9MYRT|nr:hypothetical protein MLD38_003318 [Melastoma candidum]